METALDIGLANVAVAVLLALPAAGASLIRSRPALAHALWLLVLVKLLTPPLWGVHIDRPWAHAIDRPAEVSRVDTARSSTARPGPIADVLPPAETPAEMAEVETEPSFGSEQPRATAPAAPADVRSAPIRTTTVSLAVWLPTAATLLWSSGSIVCAAVILLRVVRFQRLLRFATLASPALQGRSAILARRMGLARTPRVWFVPGAVCPMLWPLGRGPRLLIPSELWNRLGEGQRSSLLAHELAHLRRRDHWVRLPEVLASVLYWWCPLTWYARRRLREAEEQCCDAWVVWALPGAGRDYASALVETVEFVTAAVVKGIPARPSLPMLASGMGQFHQLKRRLVMIKHARVPRRLSGPGWLAVGALALGLLPLAPTLAQVSASGSSDIKEGASDAPTPVNVTAVAPVAVNVPTVVDTTPVVADQSIAVTAVAPVAVAAKFEDEDDAPIINDLKSKPLSKTPKPPESNFSRAYSGDGKLEPKLEAARAEVRELSRQLERAQRKLADLEMANAKNLKNFPDFKDPNGRWSKKDIPAATPSYYPPTEKQPDGYGSRPGAPGGYGSSAGSNKPPTDPNASRERRLDAVEANLKALLDEVRALRDEGPTPTPRDKRQAR